MSRTATKMTYTDITAAVQHLGDNDRCPFCKNKGFITCPDHLAAYTEDPTTGYLWCHTCDTAEEEAPETGCPCAYLN